MDQLNKIALFCLITLLSVGCSSTPSSSSSSDSYRQLPSNHFTVSHSRIAAKALSSQAKKVLGTQTSVIVASFVDVNDLTKSSSLGRIISQQFGSGFVQDGFDVIELLLRKNIYISEQNNGEFLLSRKVRDLSAKHHVHAVVVGAYAVGDDTVFITSKVIDIATNRILTSIDFSIPLDKNVRNMLNN